MSCFKNSNVQQQPFISEEVVGEIELGPVCFSVFTVSHWHDENISWHALCRIGSRIL